MSLVQPLVRNHLNAEDRNNRHQENLQERDPQEQNYRLLFVTFLSIPFYPLFFLFWGFRKIRKTNQLKQTNFLKIYDNFWRHVGFLMLFIGAVFKFVIILLSKQHFRFCSLLFQILMAALLLWFIFKSDPNLTIPSTNPGGQSNRKNYERLHSLQVEACFPIEDEKKILEIKLKSSAKIFEGPKFPGLWLITSVLIQIFASYIADYFAFGPAGQDCCDWWIETVASWFLQFPFIFLSTLALVKHNRVLKYRTASLQKLGSFSEQRIGSLFQELKNFRDQLYAWCDAVRVYANFNHADLLFVDDQIQIVMAYYLVRLFIAAVENYWRNQLVSSGTISPNCQMDKKKKAICTDCLTHFYVFYGVIILTQLVGHVIFSFLTEEEIKKTLASHEQALKNHELVCKRQDNENQGAPNKARYYAVARKQMKQCILTANLLYPKKLIAVLLGMSPIVLGVAKESVMEPFSDQFSIFAAVGSFMYLAFLIYHKAQKKLK